MSQQHVKTGQCWMENAFQRIRNELRDRVVITHWVLEDNEAEYRLCFQIAGQDEGTLVFTRGTLETCGKPNLMYDEVRQRIEATIRNRLLLLPAP